MSGYSMRNICEANEWLMFFLPPLNAMIASGNLPFHSLPVHYSSGDFLFDCSGRPRRFRPFRVMLAAFIPKFKNIVPVSRHWPISKLIPHSLLDGPADA